MSTADIEVTAVKRAMVYVEATFVTAEAEIEQANETARDAK